MEKQSQNNGQRRRRNNRSGGGNRNRSNNRGGRNRNGGSNSRHRNGNRNSSGRRSVQKPTAWQKFLSVITFGLLGKPKSKSARKSRAVRRPDAQTSRPVRNNALREDEAPVKEKKGRNRTEVTSGRLYVGNLSYETTEVELEELFRGIGNVLSAEVVTNARTQQSKGFAFVEMGSIDEAKRAVSVLDDQDFMGRKLIISGARSEGPRDEESHASSDNGSEEPALAEAGSDQKH